MAPPTTAATPAMTTFCVILATPATLDLVGTELDPDPDPDPDAAPEPLAAAVA